MRRIVVENRFFPGTERIGKLFTKFIYSIDERRRLLVQCIFLFRFTKILQFHFTFSDPNRKIVVNPSTIKLLAEVRLYIKALQLLREKQKVTIMRILCQYPVVGRH